MSKYRKLTRGEALIFWSGFCFGIVAALMSTLILMAVQA